MLLLASGAHFAYFGRFTDHCMIKRFIEPVGKLKKRAPAKT